MTLATSESRDVLLATEAKAEVMFVEMPTLKPISIVDVDSIPRTVSTARMTWTNCFWSDMQIKNQK
jgi:hypothetical protein